MDGLLSRSGLLAALAFSLAWPAGQAGAANVSKTYSYFAVRGNTLDEIENELNRRGPHVESTGERHPGATQMEFTTRIAYAESPASCALVSANVTVRAKVILPRWQPRGRADRGTRLIWDTLSADIKRHEESHVSIAKSSARTLEDQLKSIGRQRNCQVAARKARQISERVLAQHDRNQAEFDRVEGMNFENRIIRLLRYRIERIQASKQSS